MLVLPASCSSQVYRSHNLEYLSRNLEYLSQLLQRDPYRLHPVFRFLQTQLQLFQTPRRYKTKLHRRLQSYCRSHRWLQGDNKTRLAATSQPTRSTG